MPNGSELLGRARAGDCEALGELLARQQDACYALALAVTGDASDAEDACQDAFLRAMRGVRAYAPERGSFRAWLLAIVRAAALDLVRSREARCAREARRAREEKRAMRGKKREVATPEERESARAVHSALMALEARYRLPVMLHYVQGLTHEEVAAVMSAPTGTVASSLSRGREKLRESLQRAGYAAVPGALAALLGQAPRPSAPAAVRAVIKKIATGRFAPHGLARGAARARRSAGAGLGKGGAAMKLVAGVVLAGAVAAGVAVVSRGGGTAASPAAAPKGPPRIEYLAWCGAAHMYLDGPRLEAMAPDRPGPGTSDDAGNVWFGGRCLVRESGLIVPVFGDDYWDSYFSLNEGPASAFCNYTPASGYGQTSASRFVCGSPLEGGGKGCLYFGNGAEVKKVWKNPDKGGRWWFKKLAGGGGRPAPQRKGQSVPALEAKLRVNMIQVMPDDRLIVFGGGSFYELKDGKLVCLLGFDDYKDSGPKGKRGPDTPTLGVLGGDGAFYLGTYFGSGYGGKSPAVWRVLPDGKVEPYVHGRHGRGRDGPGLDTGYFCGPHFWAGMHDYRRLPADCLFLTAHDDAWIRRARNGRVATLCPDGEWRELANVEKDGLRWFRGWSPGPNGTATTVNDQVSKCLAFLVTGIDYAKPTTGPLLGAPGKAPAQKKGR